MVAVAAGARVVGVDVSVAARAAASALGAVAVVDGSADDVAGRIVAATNGGAHLSIDALGSTQTWLNSIGCLRKRGRHIQVGLMVGNDARPPIPMESVISRELEILGSHGMAAHDYGAMLARVADGTLTPGKLVGRTIALEETPAALVSMGGPSPVAGMTVIIPRVA
jgi:alcohol dehydrogenase